MIKLWPVSRRKRIGDEQDKAGEETKALAEKLAEKRRRLLELTIQQAVRSEEVEQ